jgi:hypothetical protein
MPRGLRQIALSISFLSPIVRGPDAFLATKIASLIFLPDRRFFEFTSFQSRTCPSLNLFDFSPQAVFFRLAWPLATAREHPEPVTLAPHQQDLAALYGYEL